MTPIGVMIVEDKALIAQAIAATLTKHGFQVLSMCSSGEEALQQFPGKKPDLILMDILLAGAMDGISTAQVIHQQYDTPIIYLSDFTDAQTVERAKKTFPANFLSKPFQEADLVRALEIAFYNANVSGAKKGEPILADHIFLMVDSQVFIKLAYNDILLLKADRSYCYVVTDSKEHHLSTSMNHVYDQLKTDSFVRVHRSSVVNVNRITGLNGNMLKVGSHDVQMGREYRDGLMAKLSFLK